MSATVLLALAGLVVQERPADEALAKARSALASGDAAAAEASARNALELSLRFVPEREIEARPDKGLLFEDMILEARKSYRERRARYFAALGDALAAQEKWAESRKPYRRAIALEPSPELLVRVAEQPDLDLRAKLDLMLEAYLSAGADRDRLEERLLATGAFRTRDALKASLDRRRFGELRRRFADLEMKRSSFPDFQAVTDAGNLSTGRLLRSGTVLVIYVPTPTCPRCSEELDGLVRPLLEAKRGGRLVEVAAFVPESDLEIARRIVRLLGMPVGVGQRKALPRSLSFYENGEIRVVARSGMTQIRLPMAVDRASGEIRQRVEAVLDFLDDPILPTEETPEEASVPLVRFQRGESDRQTLFDGIDTVFRLEAGPAPLDDLYARLEREALAAARGADRGFGIELLAALSKLRGANGAKSQALSMLSAGLGERLLETARELDGSLRRTAPGERGVFFLAVGEGTVGLVRSFQADSGWRHVAFGLGDDGAELQIHWAVPISEEPTGVALLEAGTVVTFRRESEGGCEGLTLVASGEAVYEGCPAKVVDGEVVEIASALVDELDEVDPGPRYFRRGVADGREPTSLERGLSLFASGDYAGAAAAFEEASKSIDPLAPYDATDLLYDRGRALEELGKRREALEIYRSLGDVPYQETVDARAAAIESGR